MSKQLNAIFIPGIFGKNRLDELAELLDKQEPHSLTYRLWAANTYEPAVTFRLAYTQDSIILKYDVRESELVAYYRQLNDPVYKDSCVEFFIKFNDDVNYYNLEFNCMGTALVGYGADRYDRTNIPKTTVSQIKSQSRISTIADDIRWQLSLIIPFEVFIYNSFTSLSGETCRANFFKCGEEMSKPHYLAWSKIDHPTPNFHLPEFMGQINFIV